MRESRRIAVLTSRIHRSGGPWLWTHECDDDFARYRAENEEEAMELLVAMASRAYRDGLSPTENTNREDSHHPTHRCPVGERVLDLPDHGFSPTNPMPWTGELYADSADGRTLFRLYFIERRKTWGSPTVDVVGSGVGAKPVAEVTGWKSEDQTRDIHRSMKSGVNFCINTQHVWRRWDST